MHDFWRGRVGWCGVGVGFLGGKGGERERGRSESEGDVPFERKL